MTNEIIIKQLSGEFQGKTLVSRSELSAFFRRIHPEWKETTFRWKIHDLKNKQLIRPVSREFFTLSSKPVFVPEISQPERKIFLKVGKQFPMLKFCIWSTRIVGEFMLHLPAQFITVLQVEKEAIEPVYDFLKEQKYRHLFVQPEEKEIERYVYESNSSIVLQPMVTKSPVMKTGMATTVTLEKLLVDLISDKKLFAAFQGNELIHIINTAYDRYSMDFTKFFHYAKRRKKEVELKELLTRTSIPQNIFS
ncbi:MAG: hypothetical protein LBP72_07765 [Dysgonamonadaceae bacterium]|jgi:hypothetical protein|nr:hypothetical protein [Dysgonamonadaceae bacterium]